MKRCNDASAWYKCSTTLRKFKRIKMTPEQGRKHKVIKRIINQLNFPVLGGIRIRYKAKDGKIKIATLKIGDLIEAIKFN